jgi:hypothetical protein
MAVLAPFQLGNVATSITFLDGLLAYWNLNETSGTRADKSGNGHYLDEVGGVVGYSTGIISNSAGSFTNYLRTNDIINMNSGSSDYTFQFWLKIDNASSQDIMVPEPNLDFAFYYDADSQTFRISEIAVSDNNLFNYAPNGNQWDHIAIVISGNTYTSYLNGVSQGTLTYVNFLITNKINFGNSIRNGGNYPVTGLMDEIAIWSRALSGTEITQLYNAGAGRTYPFT